MKFLSLEPFVPSGNRFDESKLFFQAIGFTINWDAGDLVGLGQGNCTFILQKFDNPEFAQNLMLTVRVENVEAFWQTVTEQKLAETFGVRIGKPTAMPYGKEVNIIDLAGVCWHFVES